MIDIKARYSHSYLGTLLFNLSAKVTKFLLKHRALYYILICTWGLPYVIFSGLLYIVLGFCSLLPFKFSKRISFSTYYWIGCIKVGKDYWGGLEAGLTFLRDQKSSVSVNKHEFGHTFQYAWLGPFALFLVMLPSAIRYWYQAFRSKKGLSNKPYDSAWFEDSATQCGTYAVEYLDNLVI